MAKAAIRYLGNVLGEADSKMKGKGKFTRTILATLRSLSTHSAIDHAQRACLLSNIY
jgi:hypothetical protein